MALENRALKGLVVTRSYEMNGAAQLMLKTLQHWVHREGWTVDALLNDKHRPEWRAELTAMGVNPVGTCKPERYDFVLINTFIDIQWMDAFHGRVPIVFWVHEGASVMRTTPFTRARLADWFAKPDVLIFQTPWQPRAVFASVLKQVPADRIVSIPCGVEAIEPRGVRVPSSVTRIVSLGTVSGRKRPLDLARAVINLSANYELHGTWVGDLSYADSLGPAFEDIKARYPSLLTWTGAVSDATKIDCLQQADIACFPSGDETFGISALEAASLGMPVVLADLPVYASVGWQHEQNCLLYPMGDVVALEERLRRLLDEPSLRVALGKAAQALARRYGFPTFFETMTRTVRSVVRRTSIPTVPLPMTTPTAVTAPPIDLQAHLQQNPQDHAAWHSLGLAMLEAGDFQRAMQYLEAAISLSAKTMVYHRNLGEICRRAGVLERAIRAGRKACKLAPRDLDAHYNLGLAYTDAGDYPNAIKCYRKALSLNPRHNLSWNNLGSALESQGDKAAALDAYEKAVGIDERHAEAQNNAGAIYSEQGHLDKARQSFESAIDARPLFVEAHHNLCSLKHYTPTDPHLVTLRQIHAQRQQLPLPGRIRASFAYGKALDDLGSYDEAFAAYAEGNHLQHGLLPMDESVADVRLQGILQTFDEAFFAQRADWAHPTGEGPDRSPIFIVGMPRSGTTLLEQILSSHASVHGAGELVDLHEVIRGVTQATAERPFYDQVSALSEAEVARIGQDYLQRVWGLSPASRYITDKMPANFFYLGLIHLALPQARIIHAMRDPMDSCFSCFTRLFNDTMEFAYDQGTLGRYYLRYRQLMAHWHKVLPAGRILDLRYEDLVADTEGQARRILDFVGLPWDDRCLRFHENPRLVKTASITQVRRPIYTTSLARWRHFGQHLTPLLQIVRDAREMTAEDEALVAAAALAPATVAHAILPPPEDPLQQEADAIHVKGIEHYRANRFDEALAAYDQALALRPVFPGCLNSKGFLLQDLGQVEEALACYEQAVALAPDMAMARLNLGMAQLKLGDWAQGWKNYEARWTGSAEAANGQFARPDCSLPHWQGEAVAEGDRILIVTEQGFGDTFQFVRYLPLLAKRFAKVGFACSVPTQRLMEWSFGDAVLTLHRMPTSAEGFEGWDWQCALMSLPLAFETEIGTIPSPEGYLQVTPPALRHWRDRLEAAAPGRFRVGLAWAGRKGHQYDGRRSLSFEQIGPLLEDPRITWVSLQKWAPEDQRPAIPATVDWIDWTEALTDFADTAALISQLDLVLSVDSSMVHLAGALGRPVWMMDRFDNEWRWLRQRSDSPWYANLRIFRQPLFGDWASVIDAVSGALQALPELASSRPTVPKQRVPSAPPVPSLMGAGNPPQGTDRPTGLSVEQAMQQANQLHAAGRLQEAEQLLLQILQVQPRQAHALHLLGVIAYQVGQWEKALDWITQAIGMEPNVALFHSNLAEMNRQQGRLSEAIRHGEQAVRLDPAMASAHSNLGIGYYDLKDYDRSEACHRKALVLAPQLIQSLNNLGSIARARKDKDQAAEWYRKALAIQPDFLESLSNLGAVLVENDLADEAEAPLLKALERQPHYPEALCNLGLVRLKQERLDESGGLLRRSLQLRPGYPEALVGLGRLLQERGELEEAERCLAEAVTRAPDKADAWVHLGEVRVELGLSAEAEAAFIRALELDPSSTEALTGLGNLRLEEGRMEESVGLFEQAIEQDDDCLPARFHLVQARKVRPGDVNLAVLQTQWAELDALSVDKRISLHYALGKAYDDLGQWDEAFPQFLEGARLKRAKLDYDPRVEVERIDRLIASVDAEFFARLQGAGASSDLPIFVLGMPRSGTTLTEQILASHPAVHGAGELRDLMAVMQQPHPGSGKVAFPDHLAELDRDTLNGWGEEYIRRLRRHDPAARHITDKMPANYLAMGLMPLMLPNARIIHVRRNPIDTCVSCFTRLFNRHQEATYDLFELGRHYAHYARLMAHWRSVMPAGSFLEIQYEDIVADQETAARQLIDWVGLDWDEACLSFHQTRRNIRTASVTQVRQPIYTSSVERWRHYEKYLGPLLSGLGEATKLE